MTVCFSFADNQKEFAETMGKKGIMLYTGDPREKDSHIAENLCIVLMELKTDSVFTGQMIQKMKWSVKGKGVCRITGELMKMKNRNKKGS